MPGTIAASGATARIGDGACRTTRSAPGSAAARPDIIGAIILMLASPIDGSVQVDILKDYRDVQGRFDRIVSIEMLEAVGEQYWPAYFNKLRACLKDGGNAVLQTITIDQARFEQYRRRPDFIQRYIFPGGMLPTVEIMAREAERAGLTLKLHQNFGQSYVRTLTEW